MKRFIPYISFIFILIVGSFLIFGNVAHAAQEASGAGTIAKIFGFNLWELMARIVNSIMFIFLAIASWFVALTGTLLNVSINITLHIKDFVQSIPAIYDVWKIIRDISGMFIIFALLYAAIQLILGITKPNFGGLIKNIIIAGVLINFSFFVTGFLIDASNVVSLALYRAIVPGQPDVGQMIRNGAGTGEALVQEVTSALFNDGGLSAIFMQSLQLQIQFDPKNANLTEQAAGVGTIFKVILLNWTSIIIMIFVGLSFLAASIAFIIRLIILIFLLAFSPVWFAAQVVPNMKKWGDEWKSTLTNQLVFMPVYLLLMYAALSILTKTNTFKSGANGGVWQGATGTGIPTEFIGIAMNAVFIIFMLNLPLLAAISMGGKATSWIEKKGWSAGNIFKKAGAGTWRYTGSKAASSVANSETFKNIAGRSRIAATALKGVRKAGVDYDKTQEDKVGERTQFAESLGHDQAKLNKAQRERRRLEQLLATRKAAGLPLGTVVNDLSLARLRVASVENERADAYSNTIRSRSAGTLFTRVAGEDRVAAAKIQVPIFEKRLIKEKEDLKETRDDIKQLNKAIKNNVATATDPAGTPTAAQTAELTRLMNEETRRLTTVGGTETDIDDLKLIT